MDQKFPALLKTLEGKLVEIGTASVSPENRSLDFKSEFVPIFKMGTRLKIIRTKNDIEVQSFTGEVYLSSERLLRIVDVTDQVLPGANYAFLYDTELDCWGFASIPGAIVRKFRLARRRPSGRADRVFPVKIHGVSMERVRFTCDVPLEEGQTLTISSEEEPVLERQPLFVEQVVTFGIEGHNSYRCRFVDLEGDNRTHLEAFVAALSLRANKLFPAADPPRREATPDAGENP